MIQQIEYGIRGDCSGIIRILDHPIKFIPDYLEWERKWSDHAHAWDKPHKVVKRTVTITPWKENTE